MVIYRDLGRADSQPMSKRPRTGSRPKAAAAEVLSVAAEEMRGACQEASRKEVKRRRKCARARLSRADPNKTILEQAAVSAPCRARYKMLWETIRPKIEKSNGLLKDKAEVENVVCNHLEEMYMDGDDLATGRYLVAAIMYFCVALKVCGLQGLPRIRQSLNGWQKLAPAKSRLPIPFEVVALISTWAIKSGHIQIALLILLSFMLYLRPSEGLKLRCQDVVRPTRKKGAFSMWTFILHPYEEGVPSKTQEFDESLQLDLAYHKEMGAALWRALNLQARAPGDKVFSVTTSEVNELLASARDALNLGPLGVLHMYRLRHGGASHDYANGLRDLASVQARGRWQAARSVRRYQKGARLAQLFASLKDAVQHECLMATDGLDALLRSLR